MCFILANTAFRSVQKKKNTAFRSNLAIRLRRLPIAIGLGSPIDLVVACCKLDAVLRLAADSRQSESRIQSPSPSARLRSSEFNTTKEAKDSCIGKSCQPTLESIMDHDSEPRRSGSFSRISSTNSSFRRLSFNISRAGHYDVDDDDSVSEAGDIGDRALHSNRYSGSGRPRLSFDNIGENPVFPIEEHYDNESQLPTATVDDKDQNEECKKELPWFLTYMSSRIHLAALGILGVLTRYLIEKLFGPEVIGATSDDNFIYTDLFPNMVGSFFMGWFGAVFKGDISKFSPELAVGLTTGYLGSLTTFSGWNQKMLELSVDGQWVFAVLGFLLGLFLVAESYVLGVMIAEDFKSALNKLNLSSKMGFYKMNNIISRSMLIVMMITMLGSLWAVSMVLLIKDFNSDSSTSHLWFGCIVGPIGVWIRFYLAKLNGQGLGRREIMKWMPFGTLIANVSASCIMAAFATMKKSVNDKHFDIVATGIQFGLCGCLSTVSTFIAEFEAMRQSSHKRRAYVYALTTIIISFTLGTLVYSVPVWTKGWS